MEYTKITVKLVDKASLDEIDVSEIAMVLDEIGLQVEDVEVS